MNRTELSQSLAAQGNSLMAGNATGDELAKGLGLALLALEELLKPISANEPLSAAPGAAATFKAKSNRW